MKTLPIQKHPDYCECTRCEIAPGVPFSWIKRVPGRPKRCPNCNSPVWDQERKRAPRTEEQRERMKNGARKRWSASGPGRRAEER